MTEAPDLLAPAAVARFLMGLARQLDELVDEFKGLGTRYAEAKRTAAKTQARAYIDSAPGPDSPKRTVAEREAITTLAAADALFEADLAKAQLDGAREAIRALHARLDVGRTLSATSRAEMAALGGRGP